MSEQEEQTRKARAPRKQQQPEAEADGQAGETQDTQQPEAASVRVLTYVGNVDVFKWTEEVIFELGVTQEVSDELFEAITSSRYSTEFISE